MRSPRPLRIALVTPGFSADDSDWCIPVLQDLACGLAATHDVRVYACLYPHHSMCYRVKGVQVRSFGGTRQGRLADLARYRGVLHGIEQDHQEIPFDAVHGFWADSGGLVAACAGRRLGIRSVLTVMGGELIYEPRVAYGKRHRLIAGSLARLAARRVTSLNVGSPYHRARVLAEQSRIDPAVVVLGTDTRMFRDGVAPRRLAGAIPVLCVGSLVAVKGHRLILEALSLLSPRLPGLHLHLAGEGVLEAELRGIVSRLGLSAQVTFHGHVPHHELPAWYRGAAFCILGSLFENLAMTILEAAACGRITVGSAAGLMPELCPPQLLAEPGDVAGLARVLQRAAEDPVALDRHASGLPQRVRENYSLKRMIEAFESLYAGRADRAA